MAAMLRCDASTVERGHDVSFRGLFCRRVHPKHRQLRNNATVRWRRSSARTFSCPPIKHQARSLRGLTAHGGPMHVRALYTNSGDAGGAMNDRSRESLHGAEGRHRKQAQIAPAPSATTDAAQKGHHNHEHTDHHAMTPTPPKIRANKRNSPR